MKQLVKEFITKLKQLPEPIKFLTNQTPDGICATAILTEVLKEKHFSIQFIKEINKPLIKALNRDSAESFIFLDISNIKLQEQLTKPQLVINHHNQEYSTKIYTLNPHLRHIETSTSVLAYLIAKEFNQRDQAYLAIIGMVSDKIKIKDFNQKILEEALHRNQIQMKHNTKRFTSLTLPLHKTLEFSTDPFIPGITGSEQAVVNLLKDNNIKLKNNNKFRTLLDLEDLEIKKLLELTNQEQKIETVFLLPDEPIYLKDFKDFIRTLQITSRLNKPSLGLATCLKNDKLRKLATEIKDNHLIELIKALNKFHESKIYPTENYIIIKTDLKETLLQDFSDIITKSKIYEKNIILLFMTTSLDAKTHLILKSSTEYNLKQILEELPNELQLQISTNKAILPQENEKSFIESMIPKIKQLQETLELPKTI